MPDFHQFVDRTVTWRADALAGECTRGLSWPARCHEHPLAIVYTSSSIAHQGSAGSGQGYPMASEKDGSADSQHGAVAAAAVSGRVGQAATRTLKYPVEHLPATRGGSTSMPVTGHGGARVTVTTSPRRTTTRANAESGAQQATTSQFLIAAGRFERSADRRTPCAIRSVAAWSTCASAATYNPVTPEMVRVQHNYVLIPATIESHLTNRMPTGPPVGDLVTAGPRSSEAPPRSRPDRRRAVARARYQTGDAAMLGRTKARSRTPTKRRPQSVRRSRPELRA